VGVAVRKLEAIVVGAGIGGLTAALSLYEIGADVEVFEASPSLEPVGVGINLLPHAVRELDALGLLDRLTERAVLPETLVYCTRRGQEIWREPRGKGAGYRWPQVSIHRGVLQEVLLGAFLERVGERNLHLGRRLTHIEQAGDRPAAGFGHESDEADVIVAADGIHSVARQQRYPDEGRPLWNGSLLWRGFAEVDSVLDGRTMIWAGHPDQKFVGYPIADRADGRQGFNFIAELRRPGSGLAPQQDWNRTGALEDFLPQFEDWDFGWLNVPAIIKAAPETYLYPMVDRDPLPRWTFGRTTLLGDAAHPMYPIGSNGASQAILDARVLAGCLRRHPDEIDVALARYEAARRPATAAIVAANRGMGPERPMALVEERAPDGFERIDDVIKKAEIEEVTEGYRRTAGFAVADLQRGISLLDEPYRTIPTHARPDT
jgi:2-polyprenyl-6-methoxyphenol hydroxylase-like FAD-dependent oxidoreductase